MIYSAVGFLRSYELVWTVLMAFSVVGCIHHGGQPTERGQVIAVSEVGGLHHHYERQAA